MKHSFLYSIKISEKTLKFGDIVVNKKKFHASTQAVALSLVDKDKIFVPGKFKFGDNGSKYFIGCLDDDDNIIRPLCIIMPQMSGYIRYFDDSGKSMSFKVGNEGVYFK